MAKAMMQLGQAETHSDSQILEENLRTGLDRPVPPQGPEGLLELMKGARELLEGVAARKGYANNGSSVQAFILAHGLSHAQGEIIMKIVRWKNLGDKKDLYKAASYLALELERAGKMERVG